MIDEFGGTWTSDPSSATGYKEYLDAIGKSDQLSTYDTNYVLDFKITGDNEYTMSTQIPGWAEERVEHIKIGEKNTHFFAGIGYVEATITLEGNKLVRTSNSGDIPVKSVTYVEGNTMVYEITAKNKTARLRLQKS